MLHCHGSMSVVPAPLVQSSQRSGSAFSRGLLADHPFPASAPLPQVREAEQANVPGLWVPQVDEPGLVWVKAQAEPVGATLTTEWWGHTLPGQDSHLLGVELGGARLPFPPNVPRYMRRLPPPRYSGASPRHRITASAAARHPSHVAVDASVRDSAPLLRGGASSPHHCRRSRSLSVARRGRLVSERQRPVAAGRRQSQHVAAHTKVGRGVAID